MIPPELETELRGILRTAQREQRIPSASAAVVRGKEVVWAEAVGLADVESGREATPNDQYRIGSITKTFTAVAIMQLRDEGKLDLEDVLERHLPGTRHGRLTIRRLLSHLSGLQREPPGELWETMRDTSRDEFVAALEHAESVLPAGTAWHYSNLAYALLGDVVVRLGGRPWIELVRERLLEPVGLGRTTFAAEEPHARGYFVEPYSDLVRREYEVELVAHAPVGQLWSTATDLCRWAAFLADPDPAVLDARTAEEMRHPQALSDLVSWTRGHGLGPMLVRHGDRILVGHDGAMPGFLARMVYSARDKVGAACLLASSATPGYEQLALDLVAATFDRWPFEEEAWRPGEAPPPELASVLGRWWSEGRELVFQWRDGKLRALVAESPPHVLPAVFERVGDDVLRTVEGRERGELLQLVRNDAGAVVRMYWATYPLSRGPELHGPDGEP